MPPLKYALLLALVAGTAAADSTSGVDGALFRSSYDSNGVVGVEGARLLPVHDLSLKFSVGHGTKPLRIAVPGIGDAAGDTERDTILDNLTTIDIAFGMTLSKRFAIGFNIGAYRTATGDGYGVRGRYATGSQITPSTGLIALRRISNIDPSADPNDATSYQGDGLAGPLDARVGGKLALVASRDLAVTLVGSVFLPFGEDEMLLGDRGLVFEPKLAIEYVAGPLPFVTLPARLLLNAGARFRQRTILEGFDTQDPMATDADAKVFLDLGSEVVLGFGIHAPLTSRLALLGDVHIFTPLPDTASFGSCRRFDGSRCSSLASTDYLGDAERRAYTLQSTVGASYRLSADVSLQAMVSATSAGARGEELRVATSLVWAPQPLGTAVPGKHDRDGDGIPDSLDVCRDEPEDKDGFQDEDGCIDPDNDKDGLLDAADKCPDEAEDKDGFEDGDGCPERDNDKDGIVDAIDRCPDLAEDLDNFADDDGCPDEDNDGDGIADTKDKCPNEPETFNGFEDEDGCPDVRGTTGPEERADRIDLKGAPLAFVGTSAALTGAAKQLLDQVATIIKAKRLAIRIEVHVPLGTRATAAGVIAAQKQRDRLLSQQRAKAVLDYLVSQGVVAAQLQAVGLGSDRPLGSFAPIDAANQRVDFIKAQQRGTP